MIQTKKKITNNKKINKRTKKIVFKQKGASASASASGTEIGCIKCIQPLRFRTDRVVYIPQEGIYCNKYMCSICYNDIKKDNIDICCLCSKYLLEGTLEKIKFGRVCHYTCVKNYLVQKQNECFCESIHHGNKEETFPIIYMMKLANENGITQYFCQTCYLKGQRNYEMCKRCHNYLPIEQIEGDFCLECQPLPPLPVQEPLLIPQPIEYRNASTTLPNNYVLNPSVNPLVTQIKPQPISGLTDTTTEVSFPVVLENPPTPIMTDEPHLLEENTINCPMCKVPIFKDVLICPHCSYDLKKKTSLLGSLFRKKEIVLKSILKSTQNEICIENNCSEIVAHQGKCIKCFRNYIEKKGKCRVCGKSRGKKKNNHKECELSTIFFNPDTPKEKKIKNYKIYNKSVKYFYTPMVKNRSVVCSNCDEYVYSFENFITLFNKELVEDQKPLFYIHKNCYTRFCQNNSDIVEDLKIGNLMISR